MRKRVFLTVFAAYAAALPAEVSPAVLAAYVPSAAQQPSPTEQPLQQQGQNPAPTGRKIKIWTNEDLLATRTPADIYMFEKEAQAAANDAAAFQTLASCFAPAQPEATVEDTQKAIQETTQSVRDGENAVAQAKSQLAEAPEGLKTRDQAELDRRTAELNQNLERLQMLQDRLQQLTQQHPAEAPNDAAPAPPQ